jgi:hypothetical protein
MCWQRRHACSLNLHGMHCTLRFSATALRLRRGVGTVAASTKRSRGDSHPAENPRRGSTPIAATTDPALPYPAHARSHHIPMASDRVTDPVTGEVRVTRYQATKAEIRRVYPDAMPLPETREEHEIRRSTRRRSRFPRGGWMDKRNLTEAPAGELISRPVQERGRPI